MKKLPTKIKINWRIYEIKKERTIDKNEDLRGQIVYEDNLIEIKEGLQIESEKVILLHEILHGIFWAIGSELRKEDNFITALSEMIYGIFKENADLLEYLKD